MNTRGRKIFIRNLRDVKSILGRVRRQSEPSATQHVDSLIYSIDQHIALIKSPKETVIDSKVHRIVTEKSTKIKKFSRRKDWDKVLRASHIVLSALPGEPTSGGVPPRPRKGKK